MPRNPWRCVSLAQRIELSGKLGTVGGGELGQFEAGARLCLGGAAGLGEQSGHLIGTDLVELVDLAQHAFDVRQAKATVEPSDNLRLLACTVALGSHTRAALPVRRP